MPESRQKCVDKAKTNQLQEKGLHSLKDLLANCNGGPSLDPASNYKKKIFMK